MNPSPEKTALLARVSSTRAALSLDLEGIGHALDVPGRIRSSFRLHPVAWVAGAVGVGIAAAALFRKGGKGGRLASWRPMLMGALGFVGNRAMALTLPGLVEILETELSRWLDRRRPAPSPAAGQEGRIAD